MPRWMTTFKPFNWSERRQRKMSMRERTWWFTVVLAIGVANFLPEGILTTLALGMIQLTILGLLVIFPIKDRHWQDGDINQEDFNAPEGWPGNFPGHTTGGVIEPASYVDYLHSGGADLVDMATPEQTAPEGVLLMGLTDGSGLDNARFLYDPADGRPPFWVTCVEEGDRLDYIDDRGEVVLCRDNPRARKAEEPRTADVRTNVFTPSKGRNIEL